MKRKKYFLRMLALLALMLPWSLQAQNARVSEYDGTAGTATYSSIVSTGTAQQFSGDYVDVQMPFAMYFGETQVPQGSTLRIWKNGSVTFDGIAALADAQIAPLYLAAGYTTTQVYTRSTAQMLTVEWRKVVSGTSSYSFQLKLYPGGDIEFCYGPMTINGSINVLVGMMSSSTDIYRVGGRDNGSDWDTIYRNTTGTTTRTLSSTYAPAYNEATGQGMVYTFTQPACVKPTSITATATAWNTINVEWTVSSNGSGYEVKYSTNADFDPSTEGSSKTVNSGTATSTTLTGLTGSTTYYIYVRKMCSGTPSGWTSMATATTLPGCYNANMPSVTPDGVVTWTSPDELVTSYDVKYGSFGFDPATEGTAINNISGLTTTIPNLGSNVTYDVYLRTHCSASGLTTDWVGPVTFTSPCVGGCTYTLILEDTYGDGWNGNVLNYYVNGVLTGSYANNDEDANSEGRNPDNDTVLLSVCNGDQISFVYSAEGSYASENNITIVNHVGEILVDGYNGGNGTATVYSGVGCYIPTCPKPSALAITDVTGNNVTLSWTENGTATAWQIAYGLFTNDNDYTVVDATTNPFTISGLGLGEWFFYVRSNCAANDQSDWIGGVSQNFGYCTPAPTSCDNNGIIGVTFGNDLVVNDNNTTTAATRYQNHSDMIGDLFAGAESEVSITYDAGYTYGTKIWIDWNNDLDFNDDGELVYTGLSTNSRPTTLVATFTVPANTALGDYRMRIGGTDNDAGPDPCYTGSYGVMRDYTVRVVAAPSCFKPNSLTVSGVTATEATLTWVEAGLSTQWEVKVGPTGFNPDEAGTSYTVNNTPTLSLNYLYMVTDYDAYVRAICNPEGPTEWSNVCSFRTFCPNGGSATMGTGTTATSGVIVNSSWGNTYCQQIFTSDELVAAGLQAGDIAGITFTWNGNGSYQKDFSIYMGNTNQEDFASTTSWVPIASQTLVYGPTLRPTSGTSGEQEYMFTTPFTWDGTSNIVISTFINQHGGSQSSSGFNSYSTNSGKTNVSMWKYRDSQAFTESEVDGLTASSRSGYRASIKLIRPCDTGSCNAPTVAIALAETEYAATLTFTDVNGETNPTYGIIYGPQGFDPTTAGTTVSPISTSTYTISNLAAQTSYDVYVYAICSGTNGRMVKYNFVTPFIPNCKTPVIDGTYGASNITYNTATLTWRQPGDAPQFWTVRYADADFNPATAAATDYTEMTVTSASANLTGLVAGTTYYVYVKATCATAPQLDESPWSMTSNASPAYTFTTPTCVEPMNVLASDVTNSTAQISWTEAGNATAWTLKYGLHGFDPDMEGTELACTATTKEITGLAAYTSYDVYVKANCTATDESGWSAVVTFMTSCPDGGDVEVVGLTAGTQYTIPVNTYYNYSYTQQIITADEIPGATNIQGLSLQYDYSAALDPTKYDVTIYIGTTDKASFASNTDFVDPATLTAVWHGAFNVEQGWNNFIFDAPFAYDGSSNIVVAFVDHVTGYNTSSHKFNTMTTSQPMTLTYYSDSYNPDPTSSATLSAYAGTKTTYSYRNVMKLMAACNTDVTCFAPASVSTSITPANVVTVSWTPRTDLRPIVNNFELKYGFAGFNPDIQGAGTLVTNLNNVFNYNITDALESDVDYDVYVRTVCGENDYSNWTKATFHTYPTCWAPSALTVMGTTNSSATLSWTENTPTPATRWEVVYGLPGFNPDRVTPMETTNNTEFVVGGLNHSTRYEFYVRAVCSATDHSAWSPVASAFTQCGVWQYEDLPLVENFDGVTGTTSSTINSHVLPNCWDYLNTSTTTSGTSTTGYPGYPIAYNSASYSHSGNNHMRFYTYTTAAYGDQYAILPQFGFDLDTVVVGFYARESSTTASYVGTIEVGVMSDPDDASTFVPVETVLPTTTSYEYFEVNFEGFTGTGRYIALRAPKPSTGYNIAYVDDLTVKLREKVNSMAAGDALVACNEYAMPDTTNGGSYPSNLTNATYVIRPAEAGKVAHITGDYDLEYGYDFLNVYRGAVNANNLIGRYTGNGTIDYKTNSNLWADSGYVTLVLTTDADNAFPYTGFKLLVQCEDPEAAPDSTEVFVENGTFAWRNGETYTNAIVRTGLTYDANAVSAPDMDRTFTADYTYVNVAGVDSVTYHMNLTLHPSYSLTYDATICQRDEYAFYGNTYNTTGTYTVALQSEFGADSTGILNLQVNPAPTAAIYNGGNAVTEITGHCDKADLTLLARSNNNNATFVWDDSSTVATRVVNPHESNTYTVVATNPTTGCTSLPASVTVTTTPVPALTISGDAEICYGQSATLTLADANNVPATYRWNNGATTTSITVNPTTTTTYTVTATTSNASACQATAEFTVVVNPLPVVTATASVNTICSDSIITLTATAVDGYTYSWNTGAVTAVATTTATATGAYTVTVTDQNGCVNEFNTATVTVNPSYELSDSLNVCYLNNPYTWGAQQITANGNYDQMFTAQNGCDSLIHLAFNFEQMGIENSNIERCYGTTYTFENITRIATVDTALTYTLGVGDLDINGETLECPKRYNLTVKVNPVKATTVPQVACDTYTWPVSGETYAVSGDYPVTLATTKNCDSVVTLALTVNYQNTGVETVTACDNYVWDLNGVTYTASTDEPTFTLQNQWGCDSVVKLDLTVNYRSYHEDFHCVRDAYDYTWINGQTYDLNVEVDDGIEFVTGTNALGCNEIAQLHLIMNPTIDSLNWTNVEACDEYEIANAVVFTDADDCNGHIEPLYLRESGDYIVRVRATDGNDQVARIHLTVTPSTYHTTIATECLPYTWTILDENNNPFEVATITAEMVNGANPFNMSVDLAEAGFITSTCSSIEVLRLTPKYPTEVVDTVVTICGNGSWTAENSTVFNGADYTTGIYTWDNSTLNADGCNLTRKVDLTVNPVYNTTADLTFCESEFTNNALTVVNANNAAESIELTIPGALNEQAYTNTVVAGWTTALGCDSMVTINYTVNPTHYADTNVVACYEYTWDLNGETYRFADGATQDHEYVSSDNEGCDFITTLHLTLNDTARGYVTRNVCTSYEYNGVTYHTDKTFAERYDGELPIANGCDSVTYITFHIQQTELIHQYVLTNSPYTWQNGQTYSQSVENVYYDAPAEGDCGNVYSLHLTMVDPIAFCDNALPYNTNINGIVINDGSVNVWNNNDPNGNDTILYYTVNPTYNSTETKDVCDSYTWEGTTYTESGSYNAQYTSAAGCDSVLNLNLTIRTATAETVTETACDSYTWTEGDGQTYTATGNYTWTTTNVAGCDSVVTLALTINVNAGVEVTVNNGCDSYTWTDGDGQTYTVSGDYSFQFTDVNGCQGDSVLHLTINPSYVTNSELVVNEAGSYTYLGVMYTAPFDSTITYTFQSINGCDSTDNLHLVIPVVDDNEITEIPVEACGSYTWTIAGVEHTYIWIPMSERQSHGMALYKDATFNKYVYTYPTDTTFVNGVMTHVDVLHLNLLESTTSTETLNIPVSLGTYTINGVAGAVENVAVETFNFTYADRGTTFDTMLAVGSVVYCDDYRTYTINYIDNYDTTEVYACADAASYEWNNVTYTIGEPGHTYYFAQKENEGTLTELVHVIKINQRAVNAETITATACDSYVWASGDSLTYTTSVTGVVYNYTDANGCAATKTLNLTVNYNTNSATTVDVCDTYTWTAGNGNTYTTSGDYLYSYTATAAGNCPSVDTLHLTIRNNTNQTIDTAACETFTWSAENGGDGRVLTTSGTETYDYTATNGCPSTNTLNLTINTNTNQTINKDECDTYTWTAEDGGNGQAYTVSGTYTYDYNTAQGCPSTNTLNLTIRTSTSSSETLEQCDSYTWGDGDGLEHTESGVYTYTGTNVAGCDSNMTLNLTINVNNSGITIDTTVCDDFTWDINNRYYNVSGTYTAPITDLHGCTDIDTLHLTINSSSSYDSVLYISDGSYRYYGQNATELFGEGVYNRTEHYTNVAGCDSALNITFNVGTAILGIDNVVNCNDYTWRNGETYVWISDAERAANLNSDNDAPLYKTSTGTYIYYNPTYTVPRENAYDSIYMLALTLTQSYTGYDEVTLNISDREVTYGSETFHFDTLAVLQQDFVSTDKEFDVHFPAVQHCDSVITLTVHLVNNYQEVVADAADICVTTDSYSWRNHVISTATNDYDHAHTYYVYDTLATGTIEYIVVNQHPLTYATERRTACDSYEWNGTVYTESTSNATAYFPAGTVINGQPLVCDSTVTLMLTINHNTSTEYTVAECNTYTWLAANGGNGETYTESGDYTYDYFTNKGCPSTNTLHLTINLPTDTVYTVDVCDTYTWSVAEGGDDRVLTATGTYTYDYNTTAGCASTNTLNLTIRNNSNQTVTKTVCDTYTWTAEENGNGQIYTTSGTYTYDYEAENGCPSTNTLNLTVNVNSSHTDVVATCDTYTWHGVEYTASTTTATYDYVDGNSCASVDTLNLTISNSTHNSETVIACQTYEWHGTTYTSNGNYTYEYTNGENCPSVDTLHLTLGSGRTFATQTVSNCGPYTWIVNDSTIGVIDETIETSTSFFNPRTGCDSVVFLNLTIFEAPVNDIAVAICDSELPYTWIDGDNTTVLTEAGEATVVYPFSANCDSTVRLTLTVNPTEVTNLTDQICLGNAYTANGFNIAADELPAAGVYNFVDHRTTAAGCEHTYNLTLTVGDVLNNTLAAVAACDSYTWNNTVYTESGNYESAPYANADGCTTIDILPLTINVNAGAEYTETVCDNYMWNGTQYTESGDYTYDYTDGNGCAGTDILHLTVNNSVINNIPMTACDSYTWENGDGQTYNASGVYTYNYTTTDGCNGTDYLVLTINTNSNTEYTETACDKYVWNGIVYTETGDYEYEYTADNGCPSTDVLHLTVNNTTTSEETAEDCNFYNWHGETYTTSGDYYFVSTNAAGCDHTTTLHLTINNPVVVTIDTTVCGYLTWNGISYDESDVITHNFTAANGCDSTEIINLTVNNTALSVVSATACDSYTWDVNGTTYTNSGNNVAILPNAAANGCDSVVTLVLTVNHNTNSGETVTACDSYTWHGANYTTSGTQTYAYTADNGCPSVDTLYLTVNNSTTGNITAEACNYYIWNGTAYNQSGNYTQTYTAANGCDSVVTMALTINTQVTSTITASACGSYNWNGASYTTSGSYTQNFSSVAGCDSVVTLNLTINPAITNNISATACESYSWNNVNYTTSGIYTHTYTAANGCDSIVTLALTVNQPKTSTLATTACGSYTWNGSTYTTSGNYSHTYTAANGCDSIVTLALTINNPVATSISESACGSYIWNGATYTTTGAYTHNYTAANGCDSVVTLNLTITPSVSSSFDMTVCGSYTWEGNTYTTTGAYQHTYTSATGCDSIVTLNLTIAPAITITVPMTACDAYTWGNDTYITSGNYVHNYTSVDGCDSIVTLALTINYSSNNPITETACDSYTWNGTNYTTSGVYTATYTAANGCDSNVTLTLTVNQSTTATDVKSACESYTWIDGVTYTASTNTPTFTLTNAAGCDSVVTLDLTINHATTGIDEQHACDGFIWIDGVNYTESTNEPTYTLQGSNGCDSVVTLHLTVNQSIELFDTITVNSTDLPYNYRGNEITAAGDYIFYATAATGCDSTVNLHVDVNQIGIDVVSLDEIKVYPNPTRGRVTISAEDVVKVEVLDIVGRRVATFEGTNTFDLSNLGEGAYTLRITLPEGVTIRKIVKK